jgi:hypothetical protein
MNVRSTYIAIIPALLLFIIAAYPSSAGAQTYKISRYTISPATALGSSPDYTARGTVGEPVAGKISVTFGPVWSVEDADLFQDNFPGNGTLIGPVRIDMARDIAPSAAPNIVPGDSMVVRVGASHSVMQGFWTQTQAPASEGGIETAPDGRAAVYCYVRSSGGHAAAAMEATEVGRWTPKRFPYVGSGPTPGGFYQFQMDSLYLDPDMTERAAGVFCFDVNDALFTPPDRLDFYFAATNIEGDTVFWSRSVGHTEDQAVVENEPMEVQCLPTGTSDLLYVDDYGDAGRLYFDTAFELLGITPDRYDVRAAAECVGNGPGSRAIGDQIKSAYRNIIWNSGDIASGTIGDGRGAPEKSPDAQLLYAFLDESVGHDPGLYLSGNNIASEMKLAGSPPLANLIGDYLHYNLIDTDHTNAGHASSPRIIGSMPGTLFQSSGPSSEPDSLFACGEGFDVLQSVGLSSPEMYYDGCAWHAAVLSQTTPNAVGRNAWVLLSAFSYHAIRDDRNEFPLDRVEHLMRILVWMGYAVAPTAVEETPIFRNGLAQNYPNPFNPTTTVVFSLKERSHVSIRVYNVLGQLVRVLADEERDAGIYTDVKWNGLGDGGTRVASGVYFCRMVAKNFVKTKKMVLLK